MLAASAAVRSPHVASVPALRCSVMRTSASSKRQRSRRLLGARALTECAQARHERRKSLSLPGPCAQKRRESLHVTRGHGVPERRILAGWRPRLAVPASSARAETSRRAAPPLAAQVPRETAPTVRRRPGHGAPRAPRAAGPVLLGPAAGCPDDRIRTQTCERDREQRVALTSINTP